LRTPRITQVKKGGFMSNNGFISITDWLKSCIKGLEDASPNKGNEYLEMTIELRDNIVENLKNLDEYVIRLQKVYDKETIKPPLGVMPKEIWKEKRIQELCRALYERSYYKLDPSMLKWTHELYELLGEV
jgi:hypothetical protein